MSGYTAEQIFEAMNKFARLPMLRISEEDQIRMDIPEGATFHITEFGFGRLWGPLLKTTCVKELD